jgi:hypothetical protein
MKLCTNKIVYVITVHVRVIVCVRAAACAPDVQDACCGSPVYHSFLFTFFLSLSWLCLVLVFVLVRALHRIEMDLIQMDSLSVSHFVLLSLALSERASERARQSLSLLRAPLSLRRALSLYLWFGRLTSPVCVCVCVSQLPSLFLLSLYLSHRWH